MTNGQRLQMELSQKRAVLALYAAGADGDGDGGLTADEARALTGDVAELETRHAAAIASEPEPEPIETREDSEGREIRSLLAESRVARCFEAAASGQAVEGREAELIEAFECRAYEGGVSVPLELLLDDDIETRGDAITSTTELAGGDARRPIAQRLFAPGGSVLEALGVRIDRVGAGKGSYPLLTGGVSPAQTAEGSAKDAEQGTFSTQSLTPKRLAARYSFTREQLAQVADLERALRGDLRSALSEQMAAQVITGNGTAPNVTGLTSRLTVAAVPDAVADFADFLALGSEVIDGKHAAMESEASVLMPPAALKLAGSLYNAGDGSSASQGMAARFASARASALMPPVPTSGARSKVAEILIHGGTDSSRGDSIAAIWGSVELIRDPYTAASSGGVSLTALTLWDCYAAFRSAAYSRAALKLS